MARSVHILILPHHPLIITTHVLFFPLLLYARQSLAGFSRSREVYTSVAAFSVLLSHSLRSRDL